MNILIINGSPRKKGLISQMLDIMREEAEQRGDKVQMVYTNDLNIKPCIGCMACADVCPTGAMTAEFDQRKEAYIDPDHISNEEFSAKYGRTLKFDPIERTQIWEDNIYNAESAAFGLLADTPRGKGFYHAHWPVLQRVLALRGIPWKTPHQLNPKVMFD